MLKELGQLAGLVRHLPKIREEMEQLQQRLGQLSAEGDAGGGMVRVKVNGRLDVVSCRISNEAFHLDDREMLEDLVRAAVNQAIERARQMMAEETSKVTSGLGLLSGLGFPAAGEPAE